MDTHGIQRLQNRKVLAPVLEIIALLERNGFKAYLVGGVVRDILMGKDPKDYDIATTAIPNQVLQIFPGSVFTGEKYGTVTVIHNGQSVEVTTLRKEGPYTDYRRPGSVAFITDLKEDLSRRDFTINALAVGSDGTLYDYFDGLPDLRKEIIRAVGDPDKRFCEDALRMMRAIRFSCQIGFSIEAETWKSIKENCELLAKISAERIQQELNAILLSELPQRGIRLLYDCGLMDAIFPELAEWMRIKGRADENPLLGFIEDVLKHTPASLGVRLAALLCDLGRSNPSLESRGDINIRITDGAEMAEVMLRRLKYDGKTIKSVVSLINYCGIGWIGERKEIKRAMGSMDLKDFTDLLDLLGARIRSMHVPDGDSLIHTLEQVVMAIIENQEPYRLKDLDINGNDLKKIGMTSGPEVGKVLSHLLELVLENPEMNQKERLLELARKMKES